MWRALALLPLLATVHPVVAQQAPQAARPRIFLDCNAPNCNNQFFRTEITWVNWVNDRAVADLHVIVGAVNAGGGGREYQLDFIGVSTTLPYEEQLRYNQLGTDTQLETQDGLTVALALGIAQWAYTHGYRGLVNIEPVDPELGSGNTQRLVSREEVDDPWNLWVFRLNGNVNRFAEETSKNWQFNGGFNASRVTPTWKINTSAFGNYRRIYRQLSGGREFRDYPLDWRVGQLVAYAIADHWSVGLTGQVSRQTQSNRQIQAGVSPALEYSFFPYEEATRRSLTVFYTVGTVWQDYIEQTIYEKYYEIRYEQSIQLSFDSNQPWGNAGVSLRASHYLHDFDLYNRSLQGNVSYRITRGVNVFANGNISWLTDQIYLPRGGVTDEEALLNLRRQATDREYGFSVGLGFQFGSIFNNVVNNRFTGIQGFGGPGGGGGGFGGGGGGGGNFGGGGGGGGG
jgi:uncharacterized membrane protein YgcG